MRGKNDDRQCTLCGEECESEVHVLCMGVFVYGNTFTGELDNLFGVRV